MTGIIVCYARCWACMMGEHYDPPREHGWADDEDIDHARETGQDPPTGSCACECAKPVKS